MVNVIVSFILGGILFSVSVVGYLYSTGSTIIWKPKKG